MKEKKEKAKAELFKMRIHPKSGAITFSKVKEKQSSPDTKKELLKLIKKL